MTKHDMIKLVAKRANIPVREAEAIAELFLETVAEELQMEGKATLAGFGTFKVRQRKERVWRNPQTGQDMTIPALRAVAFKADKRLKARLNG